MNEIWRKHPRFTSYEVSDQGRVRRITAARGTKAGRLLAGSWDRHGYRMVGINGKNRFLHHLLLETFVGPRPDGYECRHLNGVRSDNALENLCWGTRLQNHADRKLHGRTTGRIGTAHLKAKLCDAKVIEIRARHKAGETQRAIASDYGMNHSTIQAVVERRTWKHVA